MKIRNSLYRRGLVLGVIILFIGINLIPSSTSIEEINPINFEKGKTLYVGGSGPNNYTKIQDAIDDATYGDTVFVFDDSSPYYEHIVIKKRLNLIGESRDSTVIDGMGVEDKSAVTINANNVKLTGFTIQNSSNWGYGIRIIRGNENIITGNIITQNYEGISLWPEGESESYGNIISDNIIVDNSVGIFILKSYDNLVTRNTIRNNTRGIYLRRPGSNIIILNDITNNSQNIHLGGSSDNVILKNNFNSNDNVKSTFSYRTKYNRNYWGEPRINPKIIYGKGRKFLYSYMVYPREWENVYLYYPTIHVDWNPAQEPWDIGDEDNYVTGIQSLKEDDISENIIKNSKGNSQQNINQQTTQQIIDQQTSNIQQTQTTRQQTVRSNFLNRLIRR